MGRWISLVTANAAELLWIGSGVLAIYLIARLLKAHPLLALTIAFLPLAVAYFFYHPGSPSQFIAMMG